MSVFLIVPATGRESAASGVAWNDAFKSRCTIPEASRSRSGLIAYETLEVNTTNLNQTFAYRPLESYRAHRSRCRQW